MPDSKRQECGVNRCHAVTVLVASEAWQSPHGTAGCAATRTAAPAPRGPVKEIGALASCFPACMHIGLRSADVRINHDQCTGQINPWAAGVNNVQQQVLTTLPWGQDKDVAFLQNLATNGCNNAEPAHMLQAKFHRVMTES